MKQACPTFVPALVDATEAAPTAELETHLSGCPACREELETLREALLALEPLPAPEPGPWLSTKIRSAHEHRAPRLRALRWALPALVPVALIFTVFWTGPNQRQLQSLTSLEAELAQLDPDTLESVLGESETGVSGLTASDPLVDLAATLSETDTEILDRVLAETSFDYDDVNYGSSLDFDDEFDLILQTIPG